MSLTRQLRRSSQTLLLVVAPHGGQATARRNAQAGLSIPPTRDRPRRASAVPEQRTRAASARPGQAAAPPPLR